MSPATASTASVPLKRHSKACESCRIRRTKCSGEVPCSACISNGIAQTCHIRIKARPSRALPERVQKPSTRINPLEIIDFNLSIWCANQPDVSFSQLEFRDNDRLTILSAFAPPIPPNQQFEDNLMATFLTRTTEFDSLDFTDKPQLISLYSRYRALPSSLTEDQLALIYAALCTARALEVMNSPEEHGPTEDVTYFALACEQLRKWNRPSNWACWALFCLTPYAQASGGASDSRRLLEQMAKNIKELGFHRKETALLYSPNDMVDVLLSACAYLDMFTAGLLGLQPALPFSQIDVEPILIQPMFPDCMCRCVYLEAKLLEDLYNDHVDTTTAEYVLAREQEWGEEIRRIRLGIPDVPKIRTLWAELRYGWMKVLLYSPMYPATSPQIARTISQILHIYSEVDDLGQYRPCWPQLRQLSTVAHLLILVSDKGEFHCKEAKRLWDMLFDFLDRDPHAKEMTAALRRAAGILGIEPRPLVMPLPALMPLIDGSFPFDLDPLSWFTIGES